MFIEKKRQIQNDIQIIEYLIEKNKSVWELPYTKKQNKMLNNWYKELIKLKKQLKKIK